MNTALRERDPHSQLTTEKLELKLAAIAAAEAEAEQAESTKPETREDRQARKSKYDSLNAELLRMLKVTVCLFFC